MSKQELDKQRLAEILKAAELDHIQTPENVALNIPGTGAFALDMDVHLQAYGKIVHKGTYYVNQKGIVHELVLDEESMLKTLEEGERTQTENGYKIKFDPKEIKLVFRTVKLNNEPEILLEYPALLAWIAINEAETDELAGAIFKACFKPVEIRSKGKKPVKLETRLAPLTKLQKKLTDPDIYTDELPVDITSNAEKKRGRIIENRVSLERVVSNDDENLELSQPLTDYDIEVLNGISSLWEQGERSVSLADIYKAVAGADTKPNAKQLEDMEKIVERLRRNNLKADISPEVIAHKLKDPETGEQFQLTIDDFLVNARGYELTSANGKKAKGYLIQAAPILLAYAKATGQIATYPAKMLETKQAGSNTPKNILIKTYLAERIAQIKNTRNKMGSTVVLETVYKHAGVSLENRTERKRANDYIFGLLDQWKKDKQIRGYETISKARKPIKVKISV